jgi:hypothetical protein
MRAIEPSPTWDEVKELLAELIIAVNRIDCRRVMQVLTMAVKEYRSAPAIHDLVFAQRPPVDDTPPQPDPKVAVLTAHRAQKQPTGVG